MRKLYSLFSLFFVLINITVAQGTADSLLNLLSKEKEEIKRAEIMAELAIHYDDKDENKHAYDLASKALLIAEKFNNTQLIYDLNYVLGSVNLDFENFQLSLEHFNKCLVINKSLKDTIKLPNIYFNVGMIYWQIEQLDRALDFVKNGIEIEQKPVSAYNQIVNLMTLGSLLSDMRNDSAIVYLNQAMQISQENKYHNLTATIYNNIGDNYIKTGRNELALEQFNIALTEYTPWLDPALTAILHLNAADAYSRLNKLKEAQISIDKAFQISRKECLVNELTYCHEIQFIIDSLSENYYSALKNYQKYTSQFDSINSMDFKTQVANFEAIYELQQNTHKISQLEQENKIKNLQIKSQKTSLFNIVSILILLLVIVIVILFSNRSKEKLNKQLKTLNIELQNSAKQLDKKNKSLQESNIEKDKFLSIVAHDLKNPFQSLLGLSELFYTDYNSLSEQRKAKIAEMIYKSTKKVNSLLEDLLDWSRSKSNRIKFDPTKLLLKQEIGTAVEYVRPMAMDKKIKLINNIDDEHIAYGDKHMLFTIIRNLVTNAIKFSHASNTIIIGSEIEDQYCKVLVKDEGVGIEDNILKNLFHINKISSNPGTNNETGTGLGLIICQEFIILNKGKIGAYNNNDKGTTFWITLPIKNNI